MNKDQCLKLISMYGVNTWLWNASDPNYTNRGLREDAWLNISREMNVPVPVLKKKMESLMGSFRREKSREKKSRLTGSGRDDVYKSSWFAYNGFAFMSDRNEPGTTQDTMENNETDTNNETVSATQVPQALSLDNDNIQVIENQQQQQQNDTNNIQSTPRVATQDQRSRKGSKRRPAKDTDDLSDETLSEAFRILQQCTEPQPDPPPSDSYSAFGQYIANELRKYDPVTLAHVKKDICGIIFQADTRAYQQYGYYTQSYARSMDRPSTHASSYNNPMSPSPLTPQPSITPIPTTSPIQSEIPPPSSPSMTFCDLSDIPPPPLAPTS